VCHARPRSDKKYDSILSLFLAHINFFLLGSAVEKGLSPLDFSAPQSVHAISTTPGDSTWRRVARGQDWQVAQSNPSLVAPSLIPSAISNWPICYTFALAATLELLSEIQGPL
jgi:hypothetical protein